ncbi:hypothetical protein [Nostoc sp.]|uniref:hypothetical protein n=1 Tax=Nostoc sp. TaxID=1180 RepID=UPI002FF43FDC
MKVTSFSIQTSPMTSIDNGSLLTTIFVIVNDWYQKQVKNTTLLKPRVKASMSDSEIMTLMRLMDYLPFPGETKIASYTVRLLLRRCFGIDVLTF